LRSQIATTVPPLRRGARDRLARIDAALAAAYCTPEADLGNKADPLDEAIYIILTFQTDIARASSTWSQLRTAYPTWDAVERAPSRDVARALREGGLHRQKTRMIRRLLAEVRRVSGGLSLDRLRAMNDEDAERLLTRLPGLSWKAARCVLLYSLGRPVLPIDGNTFRILKRTGVLSRRSVYRRRTLHDAVQAAVSPARRRALHVNLVIHGQRTCRPRNPQCRGCPLEVDCPKVGVLARSRTHLQAPNTAVDAHAEGRGKHLKS
jgi:endonuclease III